MRRALSINDLIDKGILSEDKHPIAKTAKSGEVAWWAPSSGAPEVSGRMVQIDAAESMARNFSCYTRSGLCSLTLSSNPLNLLANTGDVENATVAYCTYVGPPNGCANDAQYTPMTTPLTWSWSSGNSNVAAIMSGASTNASTWQGVSPGSTTSKVYATVQNNQANSCQINGSVNVRPVLSLSSALFYSFGQPLPPTFTISNTTAILTASGASTGTFSWISSDASKVSFSSSSQQSNAATTTNTVSVYAAGPSTSLNDVVLTLNWTPSGSSRTVSAVYSASVDSPYMLRLVSQKPLAGVYICASPYSSGTNGWFTIYTWQMFSFFGNGLSGMSGNESFSNISINQQPGYGYNAVGFNGVSNVSTFMDTYCAAFVPDGNITTLPPQQPSLTDIVDSSTQTYKLGSSQVGSGATVQTQTLTRYRDHITVTSLTTHR